MNLPPPVAVSDQSAVEFYRERLRQSSSDVYRGRSMVKMPEDLRIYQYVIEASKPEVIVEFGTHSGASAIWFADQLDTFFGGGEVVTVDLHDSGIDDPRVRPIVGDLTIRSTIEEVHRLADGRRVMISEDSAHDYPTTMAVLNEYSDLVHVGGWIVVEDTIVDDPVLNVWGVGSGVVRAIDEFLDYSEVPFVRRDLGVYGVTSNRGGWLERV